MPIYVTTYDGIDQEEVLAILRRAKELIIEHGWCRNNSRDLEGRYCIYGAMRASGSWRNWSDLKLPWPAKWQDQIGRTVEDVYAWFDREIAMREMACFDKSPAWSSAISLASR